MSYTTIHSAIDIFTQVIEQKTGTKHTTGELIEEITDIWLPVFRSKLNLIAALACIRVALDDSEDVIRLCDEYLGALEGVNE